MSAVKHLVWAGFNEDGTVRCRDMNNPDAPLETYGVAIYSGGRITMVAVDDRFRSASTAKPQIAYERPAADGELVTANPTARGLHDELVRESEATMSAEDLVDDEPAEEPEEEEKESRAAAALKGRKRG